MRTVWPRIFAISIVLVLSVLLTGILVSDTAIASGNTLKINSVAITPAAGISVNQKVTATVAFDAAGVALNIGKQVNITYSYPGGSYTDTAIVAGSTVVFGNFQTSNVPTTPYTVNYVVDAAGQDSKSGSFTVYGPAASFTFEKRGTPMELADGTIVVMANGYSQQKFLLTARDAFGNVINASGIHVSWHGNEQTFVLDSSSRALVSIGSYTAIDNPGPGTVTASVDGVAGTQSFALRFIDGNLNIQAYNITDHSPGSEISQTKIGDIIDIKVTLLDGTNPIADIPVAVKCIWPNNTVDAGNSGTFTTDANGEIVKYNTFAAGVYNTNAINVFLAQVPRLGLIDACMVSGYSADAAGISISILPNDTANYPTFRMVEADGMHGYTIIAHLKDFRGNNAKGVEVKFDTYASLDANGEFIDSEPPVTSYATSSDLGSVNVTTQTQINPGKVKVVVSVPSNSSIPAQTFILYYKAGAPTRINVAAYPNTVACSDVINTNIAGNIHATRVVAYVTDNYGHPIPDQLVTFTVSPEAIGIVTPDTGMTDINGMATAQFALADDIVTEGYVYVNATAGLLTDSVRVRHTNDSFLNVTTTVDKSRVAKNGLVNVTVDVSGVGWQLGRKPADVIFVMDRSGSMGDAMGYTNYGTDVGGWYLPTTTTSSDLDTSGSVNVTYDHDKVTRMILKMWQSAPAIPTQNAAFVAASSDFPATLRSGESCYVNITMRNTGNLPWAESSTLGSVNVGEGLRLGGKDGTTYNTFGMNTSGTTRSYIRPTAIVNNGDTYTFMFKITAPIVHGTTNKKYTLKYQMVWDYYGGSYSSSNAVWFGAEVSKEVWVLTDGLPTPTPAPTPVPTPYATRYSDTLPSIIDSGETKTVTITMQNTGAASFPWPASTSQYALGFYNADYPKLGISNYYTVQSATPYDVVRNGLVTFTFDITGPLNVAANQTLTIYYRMYKDGVGFGQTNSKSITVYNSSIPRASGLYGDWYYVSNVWNPNGQKVNSLSSVPGWASTNPSYLTVNGIITSATSTGTLPLYGAVTPNLNNNTYAPPGIYKIQTNRYYTSGTPVSFNLVVWDDMKMGQKCDWDATAKRSARTFIDNNLTNEFDRAGLVTFNETAITDLGLVTLNQAGQNKKTLKDAINVTNSKGGTNFAAGLANARAEFASNPSSVNAVKYEIFLTDGWSNINPTQDVIEAQNTKDAGIIVFTIGIGDTEEQVNKTYLKDLATMTGGRYFFVKDDKQLLDAYATIGKIIEKNITRVSTLNLVPETAEIGGEWLNNTTYVEGSAYTMTDNDLTTLEQIEPAKSYNGSNLTLSWEVKPITIGGSWRLNYSVRAVLDGPTHPIGMSSFGNFTPYNASDNNTIRYFQSGIVYVGDGGQMNSASMLDVDITLPADGYQVLQPYQIVAWDVAYHSTGTYTQVIEFAPYDETDPVPDELREWRPISSGYGSNQSESFDLVWDLSQASITKGWYTIRVTAMDGMFIAEDKRNIKVDYVSGQILIDDPDSKVPY